MKLILITTPTYFVEEDKIITTLFDEGLDILHLRKPDTAPVYAERLLTLIPEKYHKRIVVHDHFYLKEEYKLKGIHLSHRNPLIPDNYTGHVSASCHTFDDIREAAEKGIIDKRVIALGGVDENNLLQVKDFGFGGAAILGGLWNKFDPASDYNYQELIAHFRKLKRLAD